ncbi:unnamed protein product [Clonostachys rosea f. rosea IK726]|uniref:Velvet domain-containing protein n=2 Tax=Bionectria ochroleuca TaxID=29856 RepID=A0A8H7TNK6_BIOOC|nr:unnamed protein product [Clonostachys rosea f. rosea IK726]
MSSGYPSSDISQHMGYPSHPTPPPPPSSMASMRHHPYQPYQGQHIAPPSRQPPPPSMPHSVSHLSTRPTQPSHHQTHSQQHSSQLPSNTPPRQDEPSVEDQRQSQESNLAPVSRLEEGTGRRFHLDVVQQPQRARMCGYGDKDRRPITPPPCVRLIITNEQGKEISCKDIDYSMYVLNVDLWNDLASQEVNLCRQPSSTDSATVSYAPQVVTNGREVGYAPVAYAQEYHQSQPIYNQVTQFPPITDDPNPSYPANGRYLPAQEFFPRHNYPGDSSAPPMTPHAEYVDSNGASVSYINDQCKGALNRNLIGSVAASAFCLTDTHDREGIWFVLQDLSVRLEGTYRLKFSFINVGKPSSIPGQQSTVIKGKAPILASCFSAAFTVYSAKKFPGVCESTSLSKTFATQGIKIPIRKDGNKGGDDDDGD